MSSQQEIHGMLAARPLTSVFNIVISLLTLMNSSGNLVKYYYDLNT
jgi:hypothetical protein